MMAMDKEAIAERDRVRDCQNCPTCGTPKEYRLDGCSWASSGKWLAGPSLFLERYDSPYGDQNGKIGCRNSKRP